MREPVELRVPGAAPVTISLGTDADLLAVSDADIRAGIRAGDPIAMKALVAQIDDFVENDPLLVDLSRQLQRGDGPGCLTVHGSATWAPVRGAGDFSEWGDWECWEECAIGPCNNGTAVGPYATGGWIAWHAPSGQQLGTPSTATNARKKAEMMAVIQNAGKRTRVVLMNGDAVASDIEFGPLAAKVGAEMERLKNEMG
jgi:hypothetical protein